MRRIGRALAAAALTVTVSACIGATDRADFDAEVRARGGGLTAAWIAEAVDLVASEVAVTNSADMRLLSLSINPPNRSVAAQAQRGDEPQFADSVVVSQGAVVSVTPIQNADQLPLDELTFLVGDLPLDTIETLGDTAIQEFGEDDGFVTSISIALQNSAPIISISLSSARRTAQATFDTDGTFIEVTR